MALAFATIFTGMYLERFNLDAWAIYTFAAFVAIYSLTALSAMQSTLRKILNLFSVGAVGLILVALFTASLVAIVTK